MSLALEFIASTMKFSSVHELLRTKIPTPYLRSGEREIFNHFYEYCVSYSLFPDTSFLRDTCNITLPDTNSAPKYILEKMRERYITDTLASTFEDVSAALNKGQPAQALQVFQRAALDTLMVQNTKAILDVRDYEKIVQDDLVNNAANTTEKLWFGWPFLDENYSNDYRQEVISIASRSGKGKSYLMLYNAYNTWVKYNEPLLFITMEMSSIRMLYRLLSIANNKDLSKVSMVHASTTFDASSLLLSPETFGVKRAPFYMIDGSLSLTLNEVYSYIRQFSPRNVFIDGAYILKLERPAHNRFEKAAEIIETLKRFAMITDTAIETSWQFNREMLKKKDNKDVGLEDLGLSDAIGHFSGLVLAVLQDNELEEGILRNMYILKGRDGQYGHFPINYVIRENMVNFSEIRDRDNGIMYTGNSDVAF